MIACHVCGGTRWTKAVLAKESLNTSTGDRWVLQPMTHYRCDSCDRKATLAERRELQKEFGVGPEPEQESDTVVANKRVKRTQRAAA